MKTADIKKRIHAGGIEHLNALQEAAASCSAQQMVILAPTGTGKTLAFALAALRAVPEAEAGKGVLAVIVAPSRELVQQIYNVIRPLAAPPFKVMALYGGSSFSAERSSIEGGVPDIVVATPGRLLDHLNRGTLNVANIRVFVIDEYDKVVELGFRDELRRIARRLTKARTRILTSATQPQGMPEFIDTAGAETLDFSQVDNPVGRIAVVDVPSAARDKLDTLASLLRVPETGTAMVFVNHRESAERVVNSLASRGIPAILYHGGLDQRDREISVAKLRAGTGRVLIATDLAARGLDIDSGIDSVIHYHIPVDETAWTHRNGRTARAGADGAVYVITGPDEDVPDYIVFDRKLYPSPDPDAVAGTDPTRKEMLYINAGKDLKVSRGDIAGFMMKVCGLNPDEVGLITVGRDYSLVAVAASAVPTVLAKARTERLKGKRVRITPV